MTPTLASLARRLGGSGRTVRSFAHRLEWRSLAAFSLVRRLEWRSLAALSLALSAAAAKRSAAQTPVAAQVRPVARVIPRSIADSAIAQLESLLQRYPDSPLRPGALYELGELLTRRADERFAASQRADSTGGAARPDYTDAIARYQEIVKRYPNFDQIDGAAYTLGTLYSFDQRYAEAVPMFEMVAAKDQSPHKAESLFRLGDAEFEIAANQKGDARLASFSKAAGAYERAAAASPANGDVYFLSLYKLGWAYYNTATPQNPAGYNQAVEVFGRLVDAYDKLTPDRQQRLGLREEALEYMAISFTQVGGAAAADRFFAARPDSASLKIPVLRRVAAGLRDQGDFSKAVDAYQELLVEAPDDSSALSTSREVIDIYQNRTLEPDKAQTARLALVQKFSPGSSWTAANPTHAKEVGTTREDVLRQAAQFELAKAQGIPTQLAPAAKGKRRGKAADAPAQEQVAVTPAAREHYTEAARLYAIYMSDYGQSDSAREVDIHYADALYGSGDFRKAGTEYTRAAFSFPADTFQAPIKAESQQAAQNAIVAWDSVTAHNASDRDAQDSLFAAVDNFSTRYPHTDVAKKALIEKGRRAAEGGRWDVEAQTFRIYALQYPNDPYAATAAKQVGDALYKQGKYADAQLQWDSAAATARATGRKQFADSITGVQQGAAAGYADSLIKAGAYDKAAKEVYIALADKNPSSEKAPDALRNAIETYMLADSAARARGDANASKEARTQAATLANRLVTEYPLYRYRLQYQTLYADLLEEIGEGDQSITALRKIIADNPAWRGRADAEIKIAVRLDSLGKEKEAAAAYEQFAADYRQDPRAADALYNAAVTYLQGHDTLTAARAYGTFVDRFPKDSRAADARVFRVQLLRAGGDSATAGADLNRLCSLLNPPPELKGDCAARAGRTAFDAGLADFLRYRDVKLVIATRAQLTAAGVKRASALKQRMLESVTGEFTKAIESGDPQYLAAGSYYIGYAQWEYGNFLKNVQLPKSLTDAERTAASQGAGAQAQTYYAQAQKTWQALVDKASQDGIKNAWIDLARDGTTGKVPDLPPTPGGLK